MLGGHSPCLRRPYSDGMGCVVCVVSCTPSMGGGLNLSLGICTCPGKQTGYCKLKRAEKSLPSLVVWGGRWICSCRHCRALGEWHAQSISVLPFPSPELNGPVFLKGRSRAWQGYKPGSQRQHCLARRAFRHKFASQPTS